MILSNLTIVPAADPSLRRLECQQVAEPRAIGQKTPRQGEESQEHYFDR